MHLTKCGRQPVEAITTANCSLNSAFLIIASGWGRRHDFPSEGNPVLGICCEQGVQHGRTAAGQTDDEERFANFLAHDVWIHRSEEHTSELQSHHDIVCRLLL